MKAIKNNDDKKKLGARRKQEREAEKAAHAPLVGVTVNKQLSPKDTAALLQVICLRLGITDKDNVIK